MRRRDGVRPRPSFGQIEAFRAVMRMGTVSGASAMLNASQPGVSRAVRRLEDVIGFALFERVRGRLAPTREARLLLAHVDRLFDQFDAVSDVLARIADGEDRPFRVGASPSVARRLVPLAFAKVRSAHPRLPLHLDVMSIAQMTDFLLFGRGEALVTMFPVEHPGIEGARLGRGRLVCLLPPGHRLARSPYLRAKDVPRERFVSFEPDTPHGRLIAALFGGDVPPASVGVRFAETAANLVATGLGVAIVDEFSAMGLDPAAIAAVPIRGSPELGVHLAWNRATGRTRQIAALEAGLRAALGPGRAPRP
jgi:DNA-binding transcriptional LysR family regulator